MQKYALIQANLLIKTHNSLQVALLFPPKMCQIGAPRTHVCVCVGGDTETLRLSEMLFCCKAPLHLDCRNALGAS